VLLLLLLLLMMMMIMMMTTTTTTMTTTTMVAVLVVVVVVVIIIVVVEINLCILKSVGLNISAIGRYALRVVLGTVCFSQSLVGRLTWSE